jgi:hypothetical protein
MIIVSVKIESSDFWSHSWLHYGAEMIRERILKHLFDMHVIIKDKHVISDMLMIPNEILEQFYVNKSTASSTSTSATTTTSTDKINRNNNDDDDVVDVRLRLIPNPCGLLNHYDVYNNDWLLVGTGKPMECMRLIERVVWTNLIDIDSSDIDNPAGDGDNKTSSSNDIVDKCSSSSSSSSDGDISNNIDGEIQYIDVSIDGSVSSSSSSSSSTTTLLSMLPSIPSSSILLPSSSKPASLSKVSSLLESESMDKSEHQSLTTLDNNNNNNAKDDDDDNLYAKLYELRRCRPGYSMIGPCPVDMIEHPSVKGHHFYAMSVYFYALHCIKHYSPIPLLHW